MINRGITTSLLVLQKQLELKQMFLKNENDASKENFETATYEPLTRRHRDRHYKVFSLNIN